MSRQRPWRRSVRFRIACLVFVLWFFRGTVLVSPALCATGGSPETPSAVVDSLSREEVPIDYTGDKVSYDQVKNILRGEGHVLINHKGMSMKADRIIAFMATSDVYADGNVVLTLGNQVFTGEKVHFNFKTRLGDFINGTGFVDPWYGKGKIFRKTGLHEYQITDGYITSCNYEDPHYKIKAKKIYIYPKDRLIARNVIFSLHGWDLLWSPLFTRSLKDERQRFSFIPGYNRRFGAFLLSGYNFWVDPYLNGTVHADTYTKRGFGTGVSFEYEVDAPVKPAGKSDAQPGDARPGKGAAAFFGPMEGRFKSYVIKDQDFRPIQTAGADRGDTRYRISAKHTQQLLPDTRMLAEVNALSDPTIVDDFFRDEFEKDVQPQSFVDISKNTENYRLAFFARKRINKIFTELERLPELQFQTTTLPVGETGLRYSTANTASYLHQVPLTMDDFQSIRVDSFHQLTYPFKVFRWLNIEPNAGVRETYYSRAVRRRNDFRTIFSTGVDLFTKLHKRYPNVRSEFWDIHEIRHVVEPRITYTFVPKPTRRPSDLLQFDSVDTLDRQNFIRFGLRQLMQTRREEQTVNVVDADVSIRFFPDSKVPSIDRFGKTHRFADIVLESRYRPLNWVAVDARVGYDEFNQEVHDALVDVAFIHGDDWNVSFRQRKIAGQNNLTALEILYRFNEDWLAKGFWRYDFEFSRLEEQEYTLLRDLHCWEVALTFRQRQLRDDISMFVVFRLKDYPGVPIKFGN